MATSKPYTSMSLAQLKRERDRIEKQIEKAESRDRSKAMAELVQTARKHGFDLQELIGDTGTAVPKRRGRPPKVARGPGKPAGKVRAKKIRGKVPPKYRNPDNKAETWTGRGIQPRWVKALMTKGKSLDDIRI